MLTIFTIPKAFTGCTATLQRNAIGSWRQLRPACEVIVFGDDPGVEEAAAQLGARHVPDIDKNTLGTPLLSSVFGIAQRIATYDLLMYVNADIIFFQDLVGSIRTIDLQRFLLCGRRRDLDLEEAIDFSRPAWAADLHRKVDTEGRRHGLSGLDYFVFRRGTIEMRSFAVGRPCWDNWLIYDMRRRGIPVVDASGTILAVHQNHDFSHSKFGEKERVGGPEYAGNIRLAGGHGKLMNLRDADWLLTPEGPKRRSFPSSLWPTLSMWYPSRVLLAALRSVRS